MLDHIQDWGGVVIGRSEKALVVAVYQQENGDLMRMKEHMYKMTNYLRSSGL